MRYYDRNEREEKEKKIKQMWGHGQLKRRLTISRAEAEVRALQEERVVRQLLEAGDTKTTKMR